MEFAFPMVVSHLWITAILCLTNTKSFSSSTDDL